MAKKVFVPKVEEPLLFSDKVNNVLLKGRAHGFVSMSEFLQSLPEPEENVAEVDEIFDYMLRNGIEFKAEEDKPKGILAQTLGLKKGKEEPDLGEIADD